MLLFFNRTSETSHNNHLYREYGSMKDVLQNRRIENQGKYKKKRTKESTDNTEMTICENENDQHETKQEST